MRYAQNFIDSAVLTLLHSLWQSLIILIIVLAILKLVPVSKSVNRYRILLTGLIVFLAVSISTFFYLMSWPILPDVHGAVNQVPLTAAPVIDKVEKSWLTRVKHLVLANSSFIITAWLFGTTLFMLRFTGNWLYINHLTSTGSPVNVMIGHKVKELAALLGISQTISIIESSKIDVPFVAGVISPVIFVPLGIASGLSTQQLEAIFIHELVHIKRHDYLINLFQSLLEAIYFFNPFIWKLSNAIRTEREHCCDDAVVRAGADKKAYVYALTSLEESRLLKNGLVLSASGHRNQLFNRIKRLMEGSTKNYSLRERLVPLVLLIVGFACASWFSINRGPAEEAFSPKRLTSADTTIKKKDKQKPVKDKQKQKDKSQSSVKADDDTLIITHDSDINPFLPPNLEFPVIPPVADFEMPPVPAFNMPPMPAIAMPPMPDGFNYSDEFLQKFKERFTDFYTKNQGEIEKMMKEVEENNLARLDPQLMAARIDARVAEQQASMHAQQAKVIDEQMRKHHEQSRVFEEQMHEWEERNRENMEKFEAQMRVFEKSMQEFQVKFQEELVRDGYLEKGEMIDNLRMSDDGPFEVNGKKIKESDMKKYREFHDKYFPKMKTKE